MAEGDYNVKAIISAETSKFEKGMKTAQKSADTLSSTINTLQSTINKVFAFAGISIGVNTFVNALKSIDVEASESNKQLKLLSNTVKITGAATWTSAKQMNELAKSISKNTNYSVNDIRKMETVLLGFKNITGETFTEASNAITDMATVMGMDLTSAVQTVGKALDDPIKGLDSLRRQGFAFTDEQKKELEQLVKNGKQMEAQKIILDELATTYGGAAKQAADSGKQLENNIKNLKAELGKSWDGSIEPIKKAANVLIERWTEAIKKMNEANGAAKNLKTVISSAGETGDVSDAKTLQAAKNVQLQQEYRDLFKFEEIAKKSAKERTKAEQQMYKELSQIYDVYIQSYQSQGYTYLEAIKKVQEDKKAEWTQGLNDFQMIVEKEKQLEKEREEAEKAAADKEAIARRKALTDAYDETIAKAKEEIEIRKSMGEKISEEEEQLKLLEVMKSAYLKMIEDSNGEMKEEAVRLQAIIDLQKKLEKTTKDSFKVINADWNDFEQAVINIYSEIEEEASSWTDFFEDSFHQFGSFGKEAIETIGAALVEGEDAWNNLGIVAIETIAKILEALAAELAARAAVNAATWNYAGAVAAAAGSAAALAGAGALRVVVKQMKSVSDSAKSTDTSLKSVKATIENINKDTKDFPSFTSGFITYKKQLTETEKVFKDLEKLYGSYKDITKELNDLNWAFSAGYSITIDDRLKKLYGGSTWDNFKSKKARREYLLSIYDSFKDAYNAYESALSAYNNLSSDTFNAFKESNDELQKVINTMDIFYSEVKTSGSNIGSIIIENIKSNILSDVNAIRENLLSVGQTIGQNIVSSIVNGATKTDFLSDMKDYIRENLIKVAVYTETFTNKLSEVGAKLANAIIQGSEVDVSTIRTELDSLYDSAKTNAEKAEMIINSVFSDIKNEIQDDVEDISSSFDSIGFDFESQLKAIKESLQSTLLDFQNIGVNVGNTLANAIITGMKEEDLSGEIKSYLKETFYKTQVYSKYSTELAKLGENISKIISSGTTSGLATVKKQVESIYSTIKKESTAFTKALDDIFGTTVKEISETVEETLSRLETKIESFKDTLSDLGGDISDEIVNGLSEGLTGADFMSKMKDYLKKMVIQSVVYTQSMKAEIEAIGKAISEGITKGFSETGLHEIRRDLSYVFEQANKAIDKVDTMFDTVFSGYATGTQNATKGLHLVGEAGPELVRFRGGEQVLNAGNTQKVLSDTGRTNNFSVTFNNLQDTSAFAMVQQFKDYQRQLAIDGVF